MFNAIQLKVLELVNTATGHFDREDRGQTTAEYVAITAVGVALAIAVIWGVLNSQLSSAVTTIGTKLNTWVSTHIS